MLRDGDGEKEILLGNKQLLGIFFLVVILLGVAFAGGYRLGQGSRRPAAAVDTGTAAATNETNTGPGETHAVAPEGASATSTAGSAPDTSSAVSKDSPADVRTPAATDTSAEPPLGSRVRPKSKPEPVNLEATGPASAEAHTSFFPEPGQTFLQVTAAQRDEAEGIAAVLRKKGFRAHAVSKAGTRLYRVIIGPVRDASDLNTTRASLRNTGFREIIVQRY